VIPKVCQSNARRQLDRSRKPRVTLDSLSSSSLTRGYYLSPLRGSRTTCLTQTNAECIQWMAPTERSIYQSTLRELARVTAEIDLADF